jgi:hypothetical protein
VGTFLKVTSVKIFLWTDINTFMLWGDIKSTDLYKRFSEERDHILKNKWFMSEREGKDVGFERALLDWVSRHRINWLNSFKK